MQVDPIKPMLKAPGTKRLKLRCDKLLSDVVFNFNLRRYTEGGRLEGFQVAEGGAAAFDEAALRKVVQNLKLRNFGDEELTVRPGRSLKPYISNPKCPPPHHPTCFEPSPLQLNGII